MRKPLKYRYLRDYDGRSSGVYGKTTFYDRQHLLGARELRMRDASNGTAVALFGSVAPFFAAWVLLALLLFVMGLGQQTVERQNVSSRATAAPTRLSGVDAPDVRPTARRPVRGNHPVAVTSVFEPTGR
jgi:hypothetical protein